MPPEDILNVLGVRPLEPFVIHVSGGVSYEVRHPDQLIVGKRSVRVGLLASRQSPAVYDRHETVALLDIIRLEPVAP